MFSWKREERGALELGLWALGVFNLSLSSALRGVLLFYCV